MKVLSVVGARPQFVKLAPVAEAFAATDHQHVIVHTGQHYDKNMSDVFFADLRIPAPDVHLGVGSGSHGIQTGAMLAAMDAVLDEHQPDWVLVYGDTNSTLAGTLSAVKMHLPVAHLEAGLRSFNRRMPEEHNRVLTDHAADLLLAPTQVAMDHLANEGLTDKSRLVGDVMTDVCFRVRDAVQDKPLDLPFEDGEYVVSTIHRAENTDDPARLAAIVEGLANAGHPVLLLAHPRLVAKCAEHGIKLERPDGLGSSGVVTDSGGLQKEAFLLGRVCTTLRTETEWVETLEDGWNVLTSDVSKLPELAARPVPAGERPMPYGDGQAAGRVVAALAE